MICPKCGSEYVPGITDCVDCGIPLVDGPLTADDAARPAPLDLQVVFSDSDAGRIALARSLLMSEGIEFSVVNEELQDLLGYGRFPTGTNLFIGPVRILVDAEHAEDARALLAGLEATPPDLLAEPMTADTAEDDEEEATRSYSHLAREAARIGAALLVATFILEMFWGLTDWLHR